jgi:putative membrane protein
VVPAVVPLAVISVLFVLFENIRLVRRLAAAYGGRPGFLGGVGLLWRVIAYVAATGAIALTDDLFGQFLGQDIVRRLSRRLGEGAFNGALTARLGVTAIEICRPLPYVDATPLRARHIVSELFPELSATHLVGRAFGRDRKQAGEERVFPKDQDPRHDQ